MTNKYFQPVAFGIFLKVLQNIDDLAGGLLEETGDVI